jgi:nicotinate dehydrogenase subunit B
MSAAPDALDRRQFLQGSGLLLVAAGGATLLRLPEAQAQQANTIAAAVRDIAPEQLDTWITIDTAGRVTAFFGKMDMGQGVDTAVAQIVADELDVAVDRVSVVMGDTHLTPNQGGASGSSACRQGANVLRNAAAEARRVLLERAGVALGAAPALLVVRDGRVSAGAAAGRTITYGELIADGFRTPLQWNRQFGNGLAVRGAAPVKQVADYQVVGKPVARKDIAGKVLATTEYCVHVSLPGMLHARVVRPPVAGSVPAAVDESSIAGIAGAQVVRDGDFLAVVAPDEWAAIRASRELQVRWSEVTPPFPPDSALFDHIRKAPVVADNAVANFGARQDYDPAPVLAAIAAAPRRVEAEYEVAFQSHARMAPSIGVADVGSDSAVIYADVQKPHDTRNGIAKLLGLPAQNVRVIWKPGAGSYGRSDADEAVYEAALLSQRLGKPVRVQWMRHEGHGWDPKAPAAVLTCKAGIGADGGIDGLVFPRARILRLGCVLQCRRSQGHAGGTAHRLAQGRPAQFRRDGRILRVPEQREVLGDHTPIAESRLTAAHRTHARAAGAAAAFRARELHRRGGGCLGRRSGGAAPEAPEGSARARRDRGRGEGLRLAAAWSRALRAGAATGVARTAPEATGRVCLPAAASA